MSHFWHTRISSCDTCTVLYLVQVLICCKSIGPSIYRLRLDCQPCNFESKWLFNQGNGVSQRFFCLCFEFNCWKHHFKEKPRFSWNTCSLPACLVKIFLTDRKWQQQIGFNVFTVHTHYDAGTLHRVSYRKDITTQQLQHVVSPTHTFCTDVQQLHLRPTNICTLYTFQS